MPRMIVRAAVAATLYHIPLAASAQQWVVVDPSPRYYQSAPPVYYQQPPAYAPPPPVYYAPPPVAYAPPPQAVYARPQPQPVYAQPQQGFVGYLMDGGTAPGPYPAQPQGEFQPVEGQQYYYAQPQQAPRRAAQPQPAYQPARAFNPKFLPQMVDYDGREPPGTIIVDTTNKFLYLVMAGGQAKRYGIGVGRPGFGWKGTKTVTRKAEWPDWRPPAEMLARRPDLPKFLKGGIENPLGARALYLGSSLYRIHGTNEPYTIGTEVSSGCFRLRNEDVVDLYNRVKVGTKVVVI